MYRQSSPQVLKLKKALEDLGIIVQTEKWDGYKHIDLTIQRAHLNIEIDGKQHLEDTHQILSDLEREHYSEIKGWGTVHIPNALIDNDEDLSRIANALARTARMRARNRGH